MPRARVPNASFIASAEPPFLSFLAPRLFTESPIYRKNKRQNGKNGGAQKEKAVINEDDHGLKCSQVGPGITARSTIPCPSSRHGNGSTAGGLLSTPNPGRKPSSSGFSANSVECRYADISSFARQSIRGYRTMRGKALGAAQSQEGRHQSAPGAVATQNTSTLARRGPHLASRRERALALEQERLRNYVAREIDMSRPSLMKHGQYRSLRRRIMNLEHWDDTQVNLHRWQGNKRHRFIMTRALAALERSLYPGVGQHTRKVHLNHDPMCPRWSAKIFPDAANQDLQKTWDNWMTLDVQTRKTAYKRLLVYLLHHKPARAMQFIQVLSSDRLLRDSKADVIADALNYLAKLHSKGVYNARHEWGPAKRAVKQKFISAFVHVFHQVLAARHRVCSQDLLYNLVNIAEGGDLKKVFDCLVQNRAYLGFDTMLHYANTFAKAGDIPSALRCLEELKRVSNQIAWEAVSDRQRLRWTCALILRKSMSKNQEYHETPAIVAAVVGLDVKMDIVLYNVVMHNAMEARDYATAFKVYNTLEDNGLKADQYTHSILLHGCTIQSNPAMFSQFAQHCADVAEQTRDSWLATDYLYYLYQRWHEESNKAQTLASLEQAYSRFFPTGPLDLISRRIRRTSSAPPDTSGEPDMVKLRPTPMALYIMVQAQIQETLTGSINQVVDFYERFRLLVQHDVDPTISKLAKDPIVWNAFLLAFCQKQQFASASQLIKDMTASEPHPNIYSWNIFMQAFFKSGQVQAAERVFEILRSRGVDPDQFTYGVLLRGYAKAQHVERIGGTMQYLDTDQEMEPDLLRALAQIGNRNKLMLTLEKTRVHKEVQAQEKARVEAEEEKRRWTAPQLVDGKSGTPTLDLPGFDAADGLDSSPVLTTISEAQALPNDFVEVLDRASIPAQEPVAEPSVEEPFTEPTPKVPLAEGPASAEEHVVPEEPALEPRANESTVGEPASEHEMFPAAEPAIEAQPVDAPELKGKHERTDILKATENLKPTSVHEGATAEASATVPKAATDSVSDTTSKAPEPQPVRPILRSPRSPPAKPENAFDPEVQYRKLQEQLGLLPSSSPSASEVPPKPHPPPMNTSFGAKSGHKSMPPNEISISMSRRLPRFEMRKIWARGAENTHGEHSEVAPVSQSPSPSISFRANSGNKSMPSRQTSDKPHELTLRKIWAGGPAKGERRGNE
jgi:pentatricopeptide repeat protein